VAVGKPNENVSDRVHIPILSEAIPVMDSLPKGIP
jgi:hypothetical protein